MANPVGRPREYDLKKVADDLLAWAAKDDSINLNKFCAYNDINPNTMLRWKEENPQFRGAYEQAKAWLGFRREEQLSKGKLHVKAYDLNATVYDAFGREEKLALSKHDSDLKKQEVTYNNEEASKQLQSLMSQLSTLQSERKIADINNKADNKS